MHFSIYFLFNFPHTWTCVAPLGMVHFKSATRLSLGFMVLSVGLLGHMDCAGPDPWHTHLILCDPCLTCINCPSKVVWVSNAVIPVKRRLLVVIQVAMMMISCAISFWWMSCTYCLGANAHMVSKCTFMEKLIVHTMLSNFNRPIGLDPINLFSDPC